MAFIPTENVNVEEKYLSNVEESAQYSKMRKLEQELSKIDKRDRMLEKDRTSNLAVLEEVFDTSTLKVIYRLLNKGIIDTDRMNSERLPDYHSLNVRVDKRFYFSGSSLIVYLSIWNVYGRENVSQYVWNEVKNDVDAQTQWSTLPVLGIEYEF